MFYKRDNSWFYSELNEYNLQELSTTKHLEKHRLSGQNGNFFAKSKAQVFYAILIKIPAAFSVETHKLILQFIWKCKALQIAETILKTTANSRNNLENQDQCCS